ncbi:bifunctional phosphoserine phosphatase/homoserine phosphotransferase ThrH [Porticoccus sp. W117]|uniref:bifunctional phosphoserine phosphatase/homoserine phosphotransferase ThrH n=1 Tax=Porticoccus sp. W117 TaxID=3054777 RepID=UPI0025956341|nr:bifunctional phosphoserine phosphatase/homoserine phosphotransferase ThrH [Porticoccus sp. W117]MDM3871423.1 bifunctional phosphoserine phosphatase/homoserine phosphotransferase ThrH [Porticoccus sp. W117]
MKPRKATVICLDLEGVLVPEIWHGVARHTGIADFGLTTRDLADYDSLMQHRIKLLNQHRLTLPDIQAVIAKLKPLPGAREFLDQLRQRYQVVILSDTFYEFAEPLMAQLRRPSLFCHHLVIDDQQRIVNYQLRQKDPKRVAVEAFQQMALRVLAAGDSYNDLTMLQAADQGFFFRPPESIACQHPEILVTSEYDQLLTAFSQATYP